jgi:hypothetical protein
MMIRGVEITGETATAATRAAGAIRSATTIAATETRALKAGRAILVDAINAIVSDGRKTTIRRDETNVATEPEHSITPPATATVVVNGTKATGAAKAMRSRQRRRTIGPSVGTATGAKNPEQLRAQESRRYPGSTDCC